MPSFQISFFPVGGREGVFEHAAGNRKAWRAGRFFFERHLREEIVDTFVERGGGVFVDILLSVLVEVDPAWMIEVPRAGETG